MYRVISALTSFIYINDITLAELNFIFNIR